jgi:hypothetical protein
VSTAVETVCYSEAMPEGSPPRVTVSTVFFSPMGEVDKKGSIYHP